METIQIGIPASYQEAISNGWRIVHEETPLVHGEGRLLLCKDNVPQSISIGYRWTATSYEYAKPEVVTENVASQAEECWADFYTQFGCAGCETKDAPHAGFGLCENCIQRIGGRLEQASAA